MPITEHFVSLNSRAKGLTKGVQAVKTISDVFLILQNIEKGIIKKVSIDQLGREIWQGDAMNQTRGNEVG